MPRPPRISPLFPHPTLSSPLQAPPHRAPARRPAAALEHGGRRLVAPPADDRKLGRCQPAPGRRPAGAAMAAAMLRSEEHTSELQSPDHLVFRLLLGKKKSSL